MTAIDLRIGDKVFYHMFSPKEIMVGSEVLCVAKVDPDIICIINDDEND